MIKNERCKDIRKSIESSDDLSSSCISGGSLVALNIITFVGRSLNSYLKPKTRLIQPSTDP